MTGSPLFVIITSKIEICCRFIWVSAHARVDPAPWPRNWVIQRRRDLFFTCLFSQTRQEVCLYRVWRCCSGFQNATSCARVSETESESITIPSETLSTFRSRSSIEKTCNKITITLNEYHCHIILNLTKLWKLCQLIYSWSFGASPTFHNHDMVMNTIAILSWI